MEYKLAFRLLLTLLYYVILMTLWVTANGWVGFAFLILGIIGATIYCGVKAYPNLFKLKIITKRPNSWTL